MDRAAKTGRSSYSSRAAGEFWSQRVKSTDQLSAVLSYGAPKELNQLYDQWERQAFAHLLPRALHGKRALDIGAGVGRISIMLARLGAEVVSVDISGEMLKRLKRNATRLRVTNRISMIQGTSYEIPIKGHSCDLVTCVGVLEHLPEDVRAATVLEAARVVKRSGRIYMVVNNTENPFLSRNYPLKRQRRDGYFVSLVGLSWLRRLCRKARMTLTVRAANPWYGLVHYHLYPNVQNLGVSVREFKQICRVALALDRIGVLPVHAERLFASHYLVELRKR